MKKRGLNRSYQLSETDVSLLIIAAFCSLVVVFIGYRCCKRRKGKGKRKAERRKIPKRGNHHDETGDLLNTASQVSNEDLDPEDQDISAASCTSFEEKPKRNNTHTTSSSQNQNTDKRSGLPTILQQIMASLGLRKRAEDSEGSSKNDSTAASSSKQKGKKQGKKKNNNPDNESTKKPEHTETPNRIEDGPPKANSSFTECPRTPTQDDPLTNRLHSAQLAGIRNKGGERKGGNRNSSKRARNGHASQDCTGAACKKCSAYKNNDNSEDDYKDFATKKRDVVNPVEAASKHGRQVEEVMRTPSLDDHEPMVTESHVVYDEVQHSAMDVEENSGTVRAEAQVPFMCEGTERDTRGTEEDTWGSKRDTRGAQRDARGNERHTKGSEMHIKGAERDNRGTERDTKGTERYTRETERDTREAQRDTTGSQRDTRGVEGDTRGTEGGTKQTEKNTRETERDTRRSQRDIKGAERDTRGAERDTRERDGFKDQPMRNEASLVQHRDRDVIIERHIKSVGKVYNVMQYARNEWKSDTATARAVREGYFQIPVHLGLNNLRVIRGDNYCAIRASLFQVLAKKIPILSNIESVEKIPKGLMASSFHWIQDWNFGSRLPVERHKVCEEMEACLRELANLVALNAQMDNEEGRITNILSNLNFKPREYEIRLLEAVKFLMLYRAIHLHRKMTKNEDVPMFAMIMFARDSSRNPQQFMTKHLNAVGDTGGLEQVEMHLLGYTLGVTIKVVRPSHYGQPDFIASYPDDMPDGTPVVTMVAEDDRHYNILS